MIRIGVAAQGYARVIFLGSRGIKNQMKSNTENKDNHYFFQR